MSGHPGFRVGQRRRGDAVKRPALPPEAVTMADAGRLLGVSVRTIQRFIARGFLRPFYLPGSGRPRVPLDQLVKLRANATKPRARRRRQGPRG